jgi:serine/threonine protein kinase/tetratricopeptide (TPR) repeat protein
MLRSVVTPGEVIARRFEIERQIGAGGMGTVYRARDLDAGGRLVAVKRLDIKSKNDQERFLREAAVLAELRHPGIVRYIAHGKTEGGENYIAMEWLDGCTLGDKTQHGALSLFDTVQLGIHVATALQEAHRRGIVHRDIKPANLFLVQSEIDRVKLLDFGVARLTGLSATGPTMTRTGALIGTPGYMAPEQARGEKELDATADVFALGSVLYECLTGKPPFSGANVMAVLAKILLEDAPNVREKRPETPEPLATLIASMLAKDPSLRPRDGESVAEKLSSLTIRDFDLDARAPTLRDDEPPTKPPALTTNEQRVLCVVVAGQVDDGTAKTWAPGESHVHTRELEKLVTSFEGQLDELMDGSLVISLSAQGAATDLVARAARCALALRAHLPEVPIVLATGRGMLASKMPVGEVIDRAARLLARAEHGTIQLDAATANLIESTGFEIAHNPRGPILVRESAKLPARRSLLGKTTACVGRDRELLNLESLFTECVNEPIARAVLVTGAPGIGKSRIRFELLNRVKARCEDLVVLFARGDALKAGSPFSMIADAILASAGIAEGEPLETRREKLRERIALHVEQPKAKRTALFLGELAGVPFDDAEDESLHAARGDPLLMGDAMRTAWDDWLSAECRAQPVLFVLEDLHYGDQPTVKLIDVTLRNLSDQPFMVLALARTEVDAQFPNLWSERGLQEIRLGPLTKKASEKLIREVLAAGVTEEKLRLIADRADGNPFYLEELIRAVAANREDALPETILGMVQARLDALGTEAKRVLRAASLFGGTFWRGGVLSLLGGADSTSRVSEQLDELVDREVIAQSPSSKFPGERELTFRQTLVRDAAYAMLTEGDQRLGHRLAGEWLVAAGERDVNVIAQHFEVGGDHEKAIIYLKRAAEAALEASDFTGALSRVKRAIDCGAAADLLGALELLAGEAHVWQGKPAEAVEHLERAAALLPQGSVLWYRSAAEMIASITRLGQADKIEPWVERVATAVPLVGAMNAQLVCLARAAENTVVVAKYKLADALSKQIGELVANAKDIEPLALARVHRFRARRALNLGDPGAYVDGLLLAQRAFEGAGDVRNATNERMNLGFAYAELGAYEKAEEALREAYGGAKKMGLRTVMAWAENNLGNVLGLLGRYEEAKEIESRAITAGVAQGDPRLEGNSRIYLSAILYRAGDRDGALLEARRAVHLLGSIPSLRALALASEARAALALDRPLEAQLPAKEAMDQLEELGALEEGESLVRLAYAESLFASGQSERAITALSRARDRLYIRAARIVDAEFRSSFVSAVPENARTLMLAEEHKCDESVTLRD